MTLKELNKNKVPIIKANPRLNKYSDKVLFQGKLDDANEFLGKAGLELPETYDKAHAKQPIRKTYTLPSNSLGIVREPEGSAYSKKRPSKVKEKRLPGKNKAGK